MVFYFVNTNESNREGEPYKKWLDLGYAFTSGDRQRFGKKLGNPDPGDLVFMYVSGKGIKAVGMVIKKWDEIEYHEPLIPSPPDKNEFRLRIDWFIVPPDDFVPPSKVKEIIGYSLVGTSARINSDAAERLLQHMLQMLE